MSHRRTFLKQAGLGLGFSLLAAPLRDFPGKYLSFGLVTDAHLDLIPDAEARLAAFVKDCHRGNPDFVIQLGDFCYPQSPNKKYLQLWQEIDAPRYHVLGNHDMDTSSKAETMDFWGMEKPFYSFDKGGFHFVVLDANFLYLDGNFVDYKKANFYVDDSFRTYIHPEQIDWLKEDLARTEFPTIVFSHQSLVNELWGIKNRLEVQMVMEQARRKDGSLKVIACFNGHNHIDFHRYLNGIYYFDINSLSYHWVGEKYANRSRYPEHLYSQYPHLDKFVPYKDPLFTRIHLEPGWIKVAGKNSEWLGPSPGELGVAPQVLGSEPSPRISGISARL